MTTKITLTNPNPLDPDAFEARYADQPALAAALPGVQRIETCEVWPKDDGMPPPAYRTVELYFVDYASAGEAVTTAQAAALFGNVGSIAQAGVTILFCDIQ